MLGSFCGAVLGSRVPRRWAYCALCLGSLAICQFLFSAFAAVEAVDWSFRLTIFWTAALTASFYGWLPLYLPELFPTRVRATGQGFGYNFGRLIAAGGTLIAGLLMSEVYHGNYARTGAAISLVYVVGLLVIWLAPETRGQPLPE